MCFERCIYNEPPDFNGIYVDTNVLLGAGWPEPCVMLHNLFVFDGCGVLTFLPEPVLNEASRAPATGHQGTKFSPLQVSQRSLWLDEHPI